MLRHHRSIEWSPSELVEIPVARYQLENPYTILFKETLNSDFAEFEIIDLKKRGKVEIIQDLPLLYPNGREIEILLPYILPILHKFYENLKVKNVENTANIEDDPMGLYDVAEFSQELMNRNKGKAPIGKKRPVKKAAPASDTL
nr:unnamed protein product [Callosobruchus analis]